MSERIEVLAALLEIVEKPAAQRRKSLIRMSIYFVIAASFIIYLSLFSKPSFHTNLLWVLSGIWLSMSLNEVLILLSNRTLKNYLNVEKVRSDMENIAQKSDKAAHLISPKLFRTIRIVLGALITYFLLYCIDRYLIQ